MPAAKIAYKRMNMPEIRRKAKEIGLTPGKTKKAELIHAIQIKEGYTPCFGKSGGHCSYVNCCFMEDCLKTKL